MVRLLLIIVLVLAVLVLIGFVLGYNKIRALTSGLPKRCRVSTSS